MTSGPTVTGHRLTAAELAQFAAALRQQREFRMAQLAELESAAGPGTATAHAPDVADALEHAARHALAEIDRALERLHAGRYGSCLACAAPVGRERLEILPAAALCMMCQHRVARATAVPPAGRPRVAR